MAAFQTNNILLDQQTGFTPTDSGQLWYDSAIGRLLVSTPTGNMILSQSGDIAVNTFQSIYNNTGNAASFTLGAGGSFTINDQDNPLLSLNDGGSVSLIPGVVNGNVFIGSPTTSGNLTIYGNLNVLGSTTTVNSTVTTTQTRILILNSGEVGAGITSGSGGIQVQRGSLSNAQLLYVEGVGWEAGTAGNLFKIASNTDLVNSGQILQPLDATLTALAAYNTNGFLVQTASDTFAGRTLSQGSGILITNANGVAGNPTISVDEANISINNFAGTLSIAKGGTNSSATLNNNRIMISNAGAIVEASAITASRALVSDTNGIPTASSVTATELGYVSGVTSPIQTQFTNIDTKITTTSGAIVNRIPITKADVVAGASFAGNPKTATVTFGTAFADANYSVSIMSTANRTWTVSSVAAGSFVINSNSNTALTGKNVYWTAIKHGEYP